MKTDVRIAVLATFSAMACSSEFSTDDVMPLARIAPIEVSDGAAWRLFDRSTSSAYTPSDAPITVGFDNGESLAAVKVYGASPYRLHVLAADRTTIPLDPIDLKDLGAGWHTFAANELVATNKLQLRFEPTGGTGSVPEVELWSGSGTAIPAKPDPTAEELSPNLVARPANQVRAELAPGSCASFSIEMAQPPTQWRRAHLVYVADGILGPFSLARAINGRAPVGGSWLGAVGGERTFTEEIDPTILSHETNEVRLCLPDDAPAVTTVSQLRIVGELDRGVHLATSAVVGPSAGDGAALLDDDSGSVIGAAAAEPIALRLDRLIAPDALVLSGAGDATPRVQCVDRADNVADLSVERRGGVIRLDGGASACASLVVIFDDAVSLAQVDVIGSGAAEPVDWPRLVLTSRPEHFGDLAWVGGFTALPAAMRGAVRVTVEGVAATSLRGDYGQLLSRTDEPSAPWVVAVEARYPSGTTDTRTVVLDDDRRADLVDADAASGLAAAGNPGLDAQFGAEGAEVLVSVTPLRGGSIRLGTHVGLDIPPRAVTSTTPITARHLRASELPPLDPGMINVTAPRGRGYEFLPHGQRFARPVSVEVPFDPTLVPPEMTTEDIHTYFYDTRARRWRSLDRTSIDIGTKVVHSKTDHFTVMVNAVLATPTNPAPLSFDPTALSSIAAASPAAGIDFIEPPVAVPTGDATLALPIRLPPGRGAYMPALAVRYNSAGGNDWLGLGWDVPISTVSIDTRWGVPTYADDEEPRYQVDGAELVPTLDSEGPTCPTGTGRRYHQRTEGSFSHILRCGTNPSNYYFVIRDRAGTTFTYGSDLAGNPGNPSYVSTKNRPCGAPPCGAGIVEWNLRRVVDTYGNTTTFGYQVDDISGPDHPEPARALYPQTIAYTSHPTKSARYSVDFVLDNGSRPDQVVSGRGGFKATTRRLLRSIRVRFDSGIIREYIFTYAHGQFEKSLLQSVRVYGVGGCSAALNAFALPACSGAAFLDDHSFEYLTEAAGFGPAEAWNVVTDPSPPHGTLTRGNTSGWAASMSVGVTSGLATANVGANVSRGTRSELVGFYDVNGDGLVDQMFEPGAGAPLVLYNQGPDAAGFSVAGPAVSGLVSLGSDTIASWGITASAGLHSPGGIGASESRGISNSTSRAKRLFTDLDGDGYLDQASGGDALYSTPCPTGHCFIPGEFPAASTVNPGTDPVLVPFSDEIDERIVLGDPVVQWTAPYTGTVKLTGEVALLSATPADGVSVELRYQDTLLGGWSLANPATPLMISVPGLSVTAGEAVYLRVGTGSETGVAGTALRDEVSTALTASYTQACFDPTCSATVAPGDLTFNPLGLPERTPTGALVFGADLAEELRVQAVRPTLIPLEGTLTVNGNVVKTFSAGPIRWCLQLFAHDAPSIDVACNDPTSPTIDDGSAEGAETLITSLGGTFAVAIGDRFVIRAESDFSFDPHSISFQPTTFAYVQACVPEGTGCVSTTDPGELATIPLDQASLGFYVAPVTPAEPPGRVPLPFVAPATGSYKVDDFLNPFGAQWVTVAFRSNLQGTIHTYWCGTAMCEYPPASVALLIGESLTIEVVADAALFPPLPPGTASVPLVFGSVTRVAPITFRKRIPDPVSLATPFVGGYQGWRVALWNEALPFEPATLLADIADLDSACDELPAGDTDACLDRLTQIGLSAFAPVPAFDGVPFASVNEPSWIGASSSAFLTESGRTNAARLGPLGPPVPGAPVFPDNGLFEGGYLRLSGTRSSYLGVGVDVMPSVSFSGGLNGAISWSWTKTTTDVADLTGDGVVDVIAGNLVTRGVLSGSAAAPTSYPFGDRLRERATIDYSVDLGGGATVSRTSSGGRPLAQESPEPSNLGIGYHTEAGLGIGRTQTKVDLIDLNADGLPDQVQRDGADIKVRYNLGTSLGAWETVGSVRGVVLTTDIDNFQSFEETSPIGDLDSTSDALDHQTTLTQHQVKSVDLWFVKYSRTKRITSARVTRDLQDLNGDGLPDLLLKRAGQPIRVQYNRGGGFGPAVPSLDAFATPATWTTPPWTIGSTALDLAPVFDTKFASLLVSGTTLIAGPDVLAGTSSQTSVTYTSGFSIPLYKGADTEVSLGGTISTSQDTDTFELVLVDVTGDGAPDHVLRRYSSSVPAQANTLYVKRNLQTGRANLLQRVHRPLGGSFTLDYTSVGNTVDLPQRRTVLARVEVDDGVNLGANFASPNIVTTIAYQGGTFDRRERDFVGFATVTTTRPDGGTIEQSYAQTDYALRGQLLSEIRRDSSAVAMSTRTLEYGVHDVVDAVGTLIGSHPACVPKPRVGAASCTTKLPVLVRDTQSVTEGTASTKSRVVEFGHDRFGNIAKLLDHADDAYSTDNTTTRITYTDDLTRWILGLPTDVEVTDEAEVTLRVRSATYHPEGDLATLSVETGIGTATTTFEYDEFGNVNDVLLPPNEDGERQRQMVAYDATVATYPITNTDAFGYVSTVNAYDFRFGVPTHEVDINGISIRRSFDAFGRLATVTGPYGDSTPTIAFTYFHDAIPPLALTVTTPAAPTGFAGSLPPPITVVTAVDGLGRPIEQRRTASVDGAAGMTTSGVVSRDGLGRPTRGYQPFFTLNASTSFITPDATAYTTTTFDTLDRAISTTYPDGTSQSTSYSIGEAPISGGPLLLRVGRTDPNGNQSETYNDISGQTRVIVEHATATSSQATQYSYAPTGDLTSIEDAEGNVTSLTYDLGGQRISFENEDTGLVEYEFDLAGNQVAVVEPNHRALGAEVHFHYDRDRLESIDYPSKPDVTYNYGAPGATLGRAGRVAAVTDETGSLEYEYGALGEIRRTVRTVLPLSSIGAVVFDLRTTFDSQGRLLAIQYPDGELVINGYDAGGLVSVTGQGADWSRTYADDIRYDVFGHRTQLRFGNGVVSTWSFDPLSVRLSTVTTTLPTSQPIQQLALSYDSNGNPTTLTNTLTAPTLPAAPGASTQTFTYDGVDRLRTANGTAQLAGGSTTTYSMLFKYSASHNLGDKARAHAIDGTPVAANTIDFAYEYADRPHLPSAIGATTIEYDPSGNPVERDGPDGVQEFIWDDDGRMVEVGDLANRYDASGLRVIRWDQDTDQHTIFSSPYYDLNGKSGGVKHIFAGEARVATSLADFSGTTPPPLPDSPPSSYYLHADPLGSTTVVSDQSGAVHQSIEYFADGGTWIDRAPSGTVNGYLFNGKPFDPQTGFYDFGQRFYDPRTSLWLGVDPALLEDTNGLIGTPSMLAASAYAVNNPTGVTDPDGRCPSSVPLCSDDWQGLRRVDPSVPPDVRNSPLNPANQRDLPYKMAVGMAIGSQPIVIAGRILPPIDIALAAMEGDTNHVAAVIGMYAAGGLAGLLVRNTVQVVRSLRAVEKVRATLVQLTEAGAVAAKSGPALARQLGTAGEVAAGIVKNTERIASVTGTASYRIPDALDHSARVIGEVKNVGRLSFTQQLRDFAAYAEQQGYTFELWVRPTTQLSGPLQQAIIKGQITSLRFLP